MSGYPRVESVVPLPGKRLRIVFASGTSKVYDCTPLLEDPSFLALRDDAFFRNVQVDRAGYGVVWDDAVDLSELELWIHGVPEEADVRTSV